MSSEYDTMFPHPQKGFSSVEAVEFISKALPQYIGWIHWDAWMNTTSYIAMRAAGNIISNTNKTEGIIGSWQWKRLEVDYPVISYHDDGSAPAGWTGVVEFSNNSGKRFILFSYLSSIGFVGKYYLVYTANMKTVDSFCDEIFGFTQKDDQSVLVRVWGGPDFKLTREDRSKLFLHKVLQDDIEQQVFTFFQNKNIYTDLGISYRRGLLFSGSPGNGKTAMTRHLLRECYKKFGAQPWLLNITQRTDEHDLSGIFREASNDKIPGVLILEDLDSLTRESRTTRTGLLARLDGLSPREGLLVIGTTNNPADIDPALSQRPSRFDRVFQFPLPDGVLRRRYLEYAFEKTQILDELVEATDGWSFAYLNELRITAAFTALQRNVTQVNDTDIKKALKLLLAQTKIS